MKDKSKRKYIFIDHIYAGARMEHKQNYKTEPLWRKHHETRYFNLVRDYSHKLSIEVAGHDHWEDLRSY